MFGQEIPELKVTAREMNGVIDRCADDNQTVVEVHSYLPLTFESTMDKTITFCDMKQENGFYVYRLLFSTDEKYKGRKLKIKCTGFDTYTQPLDLKAKVPVHLLVSNKADDSYNAGKFSETLKEKEYEKVDSIKPTDDDVKSRINQSNEKLGNDDTSSTYSAIAWFQEGEKNSKTGNYSEAIQCYRKALDMNPNMSDAWYNLGIACGREKKKSEALECYQKAAQLENKNAQRLLTLMGKKW
jgi:tetratricopeptide (TPR) repeat protein